MYTGGYMCITAVIYLYAILMAYRVTDNSCDFSRQILVHHGGNVNLDVPGTFPRDVVLIVAYDLVSVLCLRTDSWI